MKVKLMKMIVGTPEIPAIEAKSQTKSVTLKVKHL